MSGALVLLWLGATSPTPAEHAALHDWSRTARIELEAPRHTNLTPPTTETYSDVAVQSIEELIDQARISLGALDIESARHRIDEAEHQLEAHPELPQSAWLMAELSLLRAAVLAKGPESFTEASHARSMARALEGERAATYEELEGGRAATYDEELEGEPSTAVTDAPQPLKLEGLSLADEVTWDGKPSRAELTTTPGKHHLQVHRRGLLAWTGWVELEIGQSSLIVPLEAVRPCSVEDLGEVRVVEGRAVPHAGVRCSRWMVGRSAGRGTVGIAECESSSCGHWRSIRVAARRTLAEPRHDHGGWPAWATYTLVGAGALVATGLVLVGSGAFSGTERGRTVWIFDGLAPPGAQR